jgi:RimJ/RimL family protein N-acetyltransferase
MQTPINTSRLSMHDLAISDHDFIFELLNTEGWIKFIGNRNIHTKEDAVNYINKIVSNSNYSYLVVRLLDSGTPIGIITLIKRDYLQHHDIGFAFLPSYAGMGYAYEAAAALMKKIVAEGKHSHILATTIPENTSSINLVKKLGLQFKEQITEGNEVLYVYSLSIAGL